MRGTTLMRNIPPVGPYSSTMPRALWWSKGGGVFRMSEVPLQPPCGLPPMKGFA